MSDVVSILSPQSCKPIRLGGLVNLTAADIAHACVNCSGIGYHIISIKYGSDLSGYNELRNLVCRRLKDEAIKDGWKLCRVPKLISIAVMEYCGTSILSDKQRAGYLGVHPSTFLRVWRMRYRRIMEVLESYEQGALHMIDKRLKN